MVEAPPHNNARVAAHRDISDAARAKSHNVRRAGIGVAMALGIVGVALGFLVLLLGFDVLGGSVTPGELRSGTSAGLVSALSNLAEVLAAVLGLSLTIVAIVVQLASQRYSAKIVDLFMRDPIHIATLLIMVGSCVYVVALPVFAAGAVIPQFAMWVAVGLALLNFGILLPYFWYVFAFLQPDHIINAMEAAALRSLKPAIGPNVDVATIRTAQTQVAAAIERIADNCLAALAQQDRMLALHSVRTLERFVTAALRQKSQLAPTFNDVPETTFAGLSKEFCAEIIDNGSWVEAKTLLEFEHVTRRALAQMPEVVSQIASSTRGIGEAAAAAYDSEAIALVVRFFNTYIRHALNAGSVRMVYNILYQYRLFTEALLPTHPKVAARVVGHLVYYGRLSNELRMPFVTVTVAHDVRVLCEDAYLLDGFDVQPLLDAFLTLDEPSERKSEEAALLGVRRAQSILGAFFMSHGANDLVAQIQHDMVDESAKRLTRIRDGILEVTDRKFWEITDRGFNFDYVEPELREFVCSFFEPMIGATPIEAVQD